MSKMGHLYKKVNNLKPSGEYSPGCGLGRARTVEPFINEVIPFTIGVKSVKSDSYS